MELSGRVSLEKCLVFAGEPGRPVAVLGGGAVMFSWREGEGAARGVTMPPRTSSCLCSSSPSSPRFVLRSLLENREAGRTEVCFSVR